MKFENASIKNLESVEEYVEKLMLSGKNLSKRICRRTHFYWITAKRTGRD